MTFNSLRYKLAQGFIHHWLVAGPLTTDLSKDDPETVADSIFHRFYDQDSGVVLPPADLGSLGPLSEQYPHLNWRYFRCQEDHYVDLSEFFPTRCYARSWAYVNLEVPVDKEVNLILTTNSPSDLWLNGRHINRVEQMDNRTPHNVLIPTMLQAGGNDILLRFETIGQQATHYMMALQVQGIDSEEVNISIPTEIEPTLLKKRQDIESIIEAAYLDRYVYGFLSGDKYDRNQPISVNFAEGLESSANLTFRLQSLYGDIYQEATTLCNSAADLDLAVLFPVRSGPLHLAILPVAEEFYIKKLRLERKDLFYMVRSGFTQKSYRSIRERSKEALKDASERRSNSIYSEIAKMALKRWDNVKSNIISTVVQGIKKHEAGSVSDMLGILNILQRYKTKKLHIADLKPEMEECILGYRYWIEDLGSDCMDFTSESQQILFHTCEILAGQLMPDLVFSNTGKIGQWHQERGENLAFAWMTERGKFGFSEWDSPTCVEENLSALTNLVDFSNSDSLRELASVLIDKILFSMALNSFNGIYGSSRGVSDTASLFSARLSATSGISRLMWGMGNFNDHVMGTVSLACCQNYELPGLISKIAKDPISALWSRERHKQSDKDWEVNKVIYRTADFMLSSAQDFYPGTSGDQEHIWQATLGPDAQVFVNHPVCMSDDDSRRPNLWRGNGVLPCLAQWGDVLMAVYQLPEDDWMGFTHAYFPTAVFDDYQMQDGWAFARLGKGYLALTSSKGFEFINTGKTAFRELRSYGNQVIWLCHMGQELLDGSFENFQQKILGMEVQFNDLSIRLKSLRKDQITFGWNEPLMINEQEQSLKDFKHIESPYCISDLPATQMDIHFKERGIRLKFE